MAVVLNGAVGFGCQQDPTGDVLPPSSTASAAPDRISPGESLVGAQHVMGLEVPNGMRIAARYPKTALLTGQVPLQAITAALRKQVLTSHIEVTPSRSLFARVHVRGDSQRRVLRIEAVRDHNQTRVQIVDITPAPVVEGLTAEERWERAGRNPDGTLKDRSKIF